MAKIGEKIKETVGAVDNLSKFKKFSKLKASYMWNTTNLQIQTFMRLFLLQLYILDKHQWRKMHAC